MDKAVVDGAGNVTLEVENNYYDDMNVTPPYYINRSNSYTVFFKISIIIEYESMKKQLLTSDFAVPHRKFNLVLLL